MRTLWNHHLDSILRKGREEMKEVHSIAVAEGSEFGRRLVRYLENHVPPSVRVYHYTTQDALLSMKGRADYYLLDPSFAPALDLEAEDEDKDPPGISEESPHCILMTEEKQEGAFCRTDPPITLLDMMGISADPQGVLERNVLKPCRITAIYSPVYEARLTTIAMTLMKEGDLYLGLEDLRPDSGHKANVGDLCYYIHLRDDHILDTMEELCDHSAGIYRLDSPDLFFCLKELTLEDYRWFFDRLRMSRRFAGVFLGLGNSIIANPAIFELFDRILLLDSVERERQHALCARLKQALTSEAIDYRGEIRMMYPDQMGEGQS